MPCQSGAHPYTGPQKTSTTAERGSVVYRIAVLTKSEAQEAFFLEQILRFTAERGLFPKVEPFREQEPFFEFVRKTPPTNAILALPGVDGLNAAEHLRALCPETHIIWCSNLDFSLHAFRLRADYFLLEPVTDEALRQGLCVWLEENAPAAQPRSDHNKYSKEEH